MLQYLITVAIAPKFQLTSIIKAPTAFVECKVNPVSIMCDINSLYH